MTFIWLFSIIIIENERERELIIMVAYYIIELNGKYANKFYTYTEACEEVERLQRQFKNIKVEIISGYE